MRRFLSGFTIAPVSTYHYDSRGEPPRLATLADVSIHAEVSSPSQLDGRHTRKVRPGVNLPAVAEVLAQHGLDPAERLGEMLMRREPVLDGKGNPVLDEHGQPLTRPALPVDLEARILVDLVQYTRPKLRATEVTVKPPELTDDQIDRRLERLLAQATVPKV